MSVLLTRQQFSQACLERDDNRCVVCGGQQQLGVHHIINRNLWPDGGYYADNGVTLCGWGTVSQLAAGQPVGCHLQAEATLISCQQLRDAAGIKHTLLPPRFMTGEVVDTWGNSFIDDFYRVPGPLFASEPCQKILQAASLLDRFQTKFRYPRTFHHPASQGAGSDDSYITSLDAFQGQEVVITAKLDGENFTGTRDYCHARSLDSGYHATRSRAIAQWSSFRYDLPAPPFRICAENLGGQHSIRYENLPSALFLISIYDETNTCLSWDDTEEWAQLLGIPTVPVLYRGVYDDELFISLQSSLTPWSDQAEGAVCRLAGAIDYYQWPQQAMKLVRKDHVQTGAGHWMHRSDIPLNDFLQS